MTLHSTPVIADSLGGEDLVSVIAGVCFSHFFMRFAGALASVLISGGVCNSEVSTRRESTAVDICVEY